MVDILDVLKHYTTYATYFRLLKASESDPNVERKKAARAFPETPPTQHRPKDRSNGRAFPCRDPAQDRRPCQGNGDYRSSPRSCPLQAKLRPIYSRKGGCHQISTLLLIRAA